MGSDIIAGYEKLLNDIKISKRVALDNYKQEIIPLLKDEIIKRYFYREGLYDYYVKNNAEILKSKEVLNNTKTYNEILK